MTNEEMFEKNIKIAYKIANRYRINYLSEYEDIKQIALLALWKAVLTFNNTNAFSTYAYVVISNEINKNLRKKKREKQEISIGTSITTDDKLTIEDILQGEDNIEKLLEDMSFVDKIRYLNTIQFTDREKEVLILSKRGYKQQEIAERLHISQAQVSRIQRRLKDKILKEMEK